MTAKSSCFWVRCAIVIIALCGAAVCAIWYPFSFSILKVGLINADLSALTAVQSWVSLVFYWGASVPCFAILIIAWKISATLKTGRLFTQEVARMISLCAKILLVDLGVFFIGNAVFLLLNMNDFAIAYFLLIAGGLALSVLLFVLARYVLKAARLQELSDGTI